MDMKQKIIIPDDIIENDYDLYSIDGVEEFIDDDEISAEEAGFMQGYLAA